MGSEEITITGTAEGPYGEILTPEALGLIAALQRERTAGVVAVTSTTMTATRSTNARKRQKRTAHSS